MPIDPSIIGDLKPIDVAGSVARAQAQRALVADQRAQAQLRTAEAQKATGANIDPDQQLMQEILQETNGDIALIPGALAKRGHFKEAMEVLKGWDEHVKATTPQTPKGPETVYVPGVGLVEKPSWQPNPQDVRADGSQKGTGYLGVLPRADGGVSSEISVGVNIDGKEIDVPALVPTLTAEEKTWLTSNDISDPSKIPPSIIQKAADFARQRIAAGQSPFAQQSESPQPAGQLPSGYRVVVPAAPAKPTADSLPASAKEYEYAKTQGYKGTYEEYQNADANRHRSVTNVNAGGGAAGGLEPDAVDYTATQYRILGPNGIPTRIETADRVKILNAAAKQAKALGQTPAQAVQKQAAFKADASSLSKMKAMSNAAEAFETKANAQVALVSDLSKKVGRTQFPVINGVLLSGKEYLGGDTNTHLFSNALLTFTNEYAKIMEGSTGSVAGSSEGARRDAANLISTALNNGTIQKTLTQMQWEMKQTIAGYDTVIAHITDQMGGGAAAGAAAPTVEKWVRDKNGKLVKQ